MAIGTKDWVTKTGSPPIYIIRFTDALIKDEVITEYIEGLPVKIFSVAKTIADGCVPPRGVTAKTPPAEIAHAAERGGVATVIRPYLEALTANA